MRGEDDGEEEAEEEAGRDEEECSNANLPGAGRKLELTSFNPVALPTSEDNNQCIKEQQTGSSNSSRGDKRGVE